MEDFMCNDGSIATGEFVQFIDRLSKRNAGRPFALFMDNLKVHQSRFSMQAMRTLGITPIFNVPYSPQFNGIEAVFSVVKCNFKKQLLHDLQLGRQTEVREIISSAFNSVDKEKVERCVQFGVS